MLPPEIVSFLKPDGRLMLLKGAAGTGKTLLAVELARAFQDRGRDVFWLASRHADPRENVDLEALVPASRSRGVRHAPEPAPPRSGDHVWEVLRDLQQDIQETGALVILDSLDGLWAAPENREVGAFVAAAKTVAERIGASMVFIAEAPGPHAADHLVDGIVELRQSVVAHNLQRSCHLQKMRATALVRTAYAFSLAEGRFWAYVPHEGTSPPRQGRPTPRWGPMGSLSTGSKEWDVILGGGLRTGSVHLVEHAPNAEGVADLLEGPLVLNALAAGWHVIDLALPSAGRGLEGSIMPHMDPAWKERLHIMDPTSWHAPVAAARMSAAERLSRLERLRRESRSGPVLSVLNMETVTLQAARDELRAWLSRWTSETRRRGDVDIIIAPTEQGPAYAVFTDDAWRVFRHLGAPFMEGIDPRTEAHFVRSQTQKGHPEVRLHPVH